MYIYMVCRMCVTAFYAFYISNILIFRGGDRQHYKIKDLMHSGATLTNFQWIISNFHRKFTLGLPFLHAVACDNDKKAGRWWMICGEKSIF